MLQASRLVRLLIAALALSFAAVSANAGVDCAFPTGSVDSMPVDCPDMSELQDCSLACPPICATIKLTSESVAQPIFAATTHPIQALGVLPTRHIGPEPPPPRTE